MIGLLKMFGKGILYVIGFPFFVLALLIFGAIGIFLFLFQLIKSIIYFFTGRKFFPELPEDKELRLMRERAMGGNSTVTDEEAPAQQVEPAPSFVPFIEEPAVNPNPTPLPQENAHQRNVERAVFPGMGDEYSAKPFGDYDYVEGSEEQAEMEEESILQEIAEEEIPLDREEYIPEPEPEPEPDPIPEPTPVEDMPIEEQTIETAVERKDLVDEELEEYVPAGSTYYDDEGEEDTSSGVSIDYDVR